MKSAMKIEVFTYIFCIVVAIVLYYKISNHVYIAKCTDKQFHHVLIGTLNSQVKQRLTKPPYSLTKAQIQQHDDLITQLNLKPIATFTQKTATKKHPVAECVTTWQIQPHSTFNAKIKPIDLQTILYRYDWEISTQTFQDTPFTLNANQDDIWDAVTLPENTQLINSLAEIVFTATELPLNTPTEQTASAPQPTEVDKFLQQQLNDIQAQIDAIPQDEMDALINQFTPQQQAAWVNIRASLTQQLNECVASAEKIEHHKTAQVAILRCLLNHKTAKLKFVRHISTR